VLDVTSGGNLFEAGTGARTDGVTLLKDRVTGIVDLGIVPSLPACETALDTCREAAEALA
jgi:two-component system chemotaxis sensor kinase CheA